MISSYKVLNNVQTYLLTWGDPFDCDGKDVIVCVTGNPGLPDFYTEFGTRLYERTGFPVCVVGHSGHEQVPDEKSNILKGQEHLFNLQGEIRHKLDLIDNIDKNSKLHLIGHSIGAWMVIEALNQNEILLEKKRIKTVNLLFPTIEKMATTRNGFYLNNIIRNIHSLALILFTLFHILPDFIRLFLLRLYLKVQGLPMHYTNRVDKFMNPKALEKILFLAYGEMDYVKEINVEMLHKIKCISNIIYSANDGWVPAHFKDDMKQFQPELNITEVEIDHSFVLKSSEIVANMVADYIQKK